MGQPLVIKNCLNGSLVNTVFYRYSGYTVEAISSVGSLRDAVNTYYCNNYYDSSLSVVDNFNLACLRGVAGIVYDDVESIVYVRSLMSSASDDVFGARWTGALISFTKHGMSKSLLASSVVITVNWVEVDGILSIEDSTFDFSLATNYLYTFEDIEGSRCDASFEPRMSDIDIDLLDNYLPDEALSLSLRDKLFYIVDNCVYDCVQELDFTSVVCDELPEIWYSEKESSIMCCIS